MTWTIYRQQVLSTEKKLLLDDTRFILPPFIIVRKDTTDYFSPNFPRVKRTDLSPTYMDVQQYVFLCLTYFA